MEAQQLGTDARMHEASLVDRKPRGAGMRAGFSLGDLRASARCDDDMNVGFQQIEQWGDVPAGTLVTDGSESYVIKRDPRTTRVILLNMRGEPVKRFDRDLPIDHAVWKSARF